MRQPVLKTGAGNTVAGSSPVPSAKNLEGWPSGLRRTPGKRVCSPKAGTVGSNPTPSARYRMVGTQDRRLDARSRLALRACGFESRADRAGRSSSTGRASGLYPEG